MYLIGFQDSSEVADKLRRAVLTPLHRAVVKAAMDPEQAPESYEEALSRSKLVAFLLPGVPIEIWRLRAEDPGKAEYVATVTAVAGDAAPAASAAGSLQA